ncbi:MAG: NAD(P)-dependent oxidoreductase [Streptosporangiaceae bacterium]|nr:NAD(P)-dependent oxidoreductase [Streptosporangiaceae bacterium]
MRIFVAGATGAVGQHLVPLLTAAGHQVTGTTRSEAKAATLRAQGATPAIVDGLDREGVRTAVKAAKPDVVIHQMTALASISMNSFRNMDRAFAGTNELRTKGTDYLLEAASDANVSRFIAQSYIGWNAERTGSMVKTEEDPTDRHPPATAAESLAAIEHVDSAVPAHGGIVLRYGSFYGPGASDLMLTAVRKRRVPVVGSGAGVWSFIEVTDAAAATVAAVTKGDPGVYNIVDDDPAPVSVWLPYLAECLDAKPPMHAPAWLGRIAAGELAVIQMTQARGASNAKARRELDWEPKYPSWRDGFRAWVKA